MQFFDCQVENYTVLYAAQDYACNFVSPADIVVARCVHHYVTGYIYTSLEHGKETHTGFHHTH